MMTSNNAEVMNFVFKGIRSLPVTAIVETTYYKSNIYFVKYRNIAVNVERVGKFGQMK